MAKRQNRSPPTKQLTPRQAQRYVKRLRKAVEAAAKDHDPNSRAAARRRKQMLSGKLTASNGVVMQFADDLDGTSGQDRESYSDTQDRESYLGDEGFEARRGNRCISCGEPTAEQQFCDTCAELLDKEESNG